MIVETTTNLLINSWRFPDTLAPLQLNQRLRIATVHNSGGFGSSAPGISFASSVISSRSWFVVTTIDAILEIRSPIPPKNALRHSFKRSLLRNFKKANRSLSLFEGAKTRVRVGLELSEVFVVKVRAHQASALLTLLFAIVVKVISERVRCCMWMIWF